MANNFKTNPLYLQIKDKLKKTYKHDFEDKDDYIIIYKKSMTFVIEAYDTYGNPNEFYIVGGLQNVELYYDKTDAYNDNYRLPDWDIRTEKDVDEFLSDFELMVKTADADKRCVRIMKAVDKLHEMVEDDFFDTEFTIEYLTKVFDFY